MKDSNKNNNNNNKNNNLQSAIDKNQIRLSKYLFPILHANRK